MADTIEGLEQQMRGDLTAVRVYAEAWLKEFTSKPNGAEAAWYDSLHESALRDFRRAERKLRRLRKRAQRQNDREPAPR